MADHAEAEKNEIKKGTKVAHSIVEIQETNGQDLSGLQTKKSVNQIFDERFEELANSSTKSTTIFKVNVGLRKSNPAAYAPMLISIGPYYHNRSPNFRWMEKYKLLYLRRFLNRKKGIIDVESCIRELESLKNIVLMCYDDRETHGKDIIGKFSEIMLLDGCFLVEFIRERSGIRPKGEERYQPIIDSAWMINQVCRDMVVLENQLPLFVLTKLYDMTKHPTEESFLYMVAHTLRNVSPKKTCIPKSEIDRLDAKQFDHLLHVVHMVSCLSKKSKMEISDNHNSEQYLHFSSVTELHEAGVSFKKIGEKKPDYTDKITLLDIKFDKDKGLLEIPYFAVESASETFLRNLIAFEQHSDKVIPYFSNYAHIMDQLISSPKDVQLLRESGIILNDIGDGRVESFLMI